MLTRAVSICIFYIHVHVYTYKYTYTYRSRAPAPFADGVSAGEQHALAPAARRAGDVCVCVKESVCERERESE